MLAIQSAFAAAAAAAATIAYNASCQQRCLFWQQIEANENSAALEKERNAVAFTLQVKAVGNTPDVIAPAASNAVWCHR